MGAKRTRSPRDQRRRAYGQNFLADPRLAARLARESRIETSDLVLELGAGTGALTSELACRARSIQAVELDPTWAQRLRERFAANPCVEVVEADLLRVRLPAEPFRVVANAPFNVTTSLLHRLLDDPSTPLVRADLVVQWEVARKRSGRPTTALSAAWSPWWRFRLGRRISRAAFRPRPAVDAGVLVVERRRPPLLAPETARPFAVFVQSLFSGRLQRELDAETWADLFSAWAKRP